MALNGYKIENESYCWYSPTMEKEYGTVTYCDKNGDYLICTLATPTENLECKYSDDLIFIGKGVWVHSSIRWIKGWINRFNGKLMNDFVNDDITIEEIMQRANDCEKYTGVGLWSMNM